MDEKRRPRLPRWLDVGVVRRAALSLVLAALLWGWVTNLEDPETSRRVSGVTPAVANGAPTLLVDDSRLPAVAVEVRGPRSVVDQLTPDDLQVQVDLGGVREPGTKELPITARPPRGVRVTAINPPTATVAVDQLVAKAVPLEVERQPAPPPFNIGPVEGLPGTVTVRGPASAVARVARAVVPIALGDRRENFEAQFTPEPRDAAGARVRGVAVEPAAVGGTVVVERVGRIVSIVADLRGEPAEGYRVAGATVSPSFVTVDGPPDVLNQLIVISTAPIDVTDRAESFSMLDVPLVLPVNTRLVERATINAQVQIEAQQQRQQFPAVRVMAINVAPGLRVAAITPPEIAVTLSGSLERLRQLNSGDVRVVVDVQGRPAGLHRLEPRILAPSDLRPADRPATVQVQLERIPSPTPVPSPTPSPAPSPSPTPAPSPAAPTGSRPSGSTESRRGGTENR